MQPATASSMSRGAAAAGTGKKLAHHVSWLWRGPRRALCAARDLYVRILTGCASHLPADAAFGYPTFAAHGFASASSSRRSSSADADEDLRELIRAASQRRRAAEQEQRQRHPAAVPRSHSVAMARIDEDGPSDFASAAAAVVTFPRSRSYAPAGSARRRGSPLSPPDTFAVQFCLFLLVSL